ncbi:hypothetical protein NC651_026623 [Populus alba x Populus x berolinensis]|nr:hypothetical protein NC651_026623 [Populus alba x Populus x berolinensis]
MKSLKIFLLLAMLMALAYTLSATTEEDSFVAIENDDDSTNEDMKILIFPGLVPKKQHLLCERQTGF